MNENIEFIQDVLNKIKSEIKKVIIGQDEIIEKALITIVTGNHALIEGVPGVAKTLLIRALGKVLDLPFNRIQFTPDLMPADITGTNVFNMQKSTFELVKGPIFASFLLGDEINRAPAKTQSALLQAMQEGLVTIDGVTYRLPDFFTVFATQNPIEYEGTYPLPEAQKDRFMLKINMSYPEQEEECLLAKHFLEGKSPQEILESDYIENCSNAETLLRVQKCLDSVTLRKEIVDYIVSIVRATRNDESILVGAGPRGTQSLLLATRAMVVFRGRDYVTPDDVKEMASSALEHRISLKPEFEIEGLTHAEAIENVIQNIEIPR